MRFKIDENLPEESAAIFVQAGHDAVTIVCQRMGGSQDPAVAAVCKAEGRALVTLDLDFADIRTYPPADYAGIIVFRPATQGKRHVLRLLQSVIQRLSTENLAGVLWVVDEVGIRIRGSR